MAIKALMLVLLYAPKGSSYSNLITRLRLMRNEG
jgi:hypothetical protein